MVNSKFKNPQPRQAKRGGQNSKLIGNWKLEIGNSIDWRTIYG